MWQLSELARVFESLYQSLLHPGNLVVQSTPSSPPPLLPGWRRAITRRTLSHRRVRVLFWIIAFRQRADGLEWSLFFRSPTNSRAELLFFVFAIMDSAPFFFVFGQPFGFCFFYDESTSRWKSEKRGRGDRKRAGRRKRNYAAVLERRMSLNDEVAA